MTLTMGMANTVLVPLDRRGLPVKRHLNMVKCIVFQVIGSVDEFKQEVLGKACAVINDRQVGIRIKLTGLADIVADFITYSLQHTDETHKLLEHTDARIKS